MSGDLRTIGAIRTAHPRSVAGIVEQLRAHGGLEGNLSARYSRLRQRIPMVTPGQWLYYAGASTLKRSPNAARYAGLIFSSLEFPAGVMRFEGCSGQELLSIGFPDIARKIAEMTASLICETRACGVICGSPRDAWMFQETYPDWGIDLGVPVTRTSILLATIFREGYLSLPAPAEKRKTAFIGSLGSTAWMQETEIMKPLLDALSVGTFIQIPALEDSPANEATGWAAATEDKIGSLAAHYWDAASAAGVERIITDEPLTFEALHNLLDGPGIEVVDVCQAVHQQLVR